MIVSYPATVTATCSVLLYAQKASPLLTAPPIYRPVKAHSLQVALLLRVCHIQLTAGPSVSTEGADFFSWHSRVLLLELFLGLTSSIYPWVFHVVEPGSLSVFSLRWVHSLKTALHAVTFLWSRARSKRYWIHVNKFVKDLTVSLWKRKN